MPLALAKEHSEAAEDEHAETPAKLGFGDHTSYALQIEYQSGPWSLRSEYGIHDEDSSEVEASYVELARMVGEHWQLAGRFDSVDINPTDDTVPAGGRSVLKHEDLALGVNYWFNANFVLKFVYHQVDGNLFTHPADLFQAIIEDRLDTSTDAIEFGAQFSF